MASLTITEYFKRLRSQPLCRTEISLEAAPSLPVPLAQGKRLYVGVLLLRTRTVEKGKIEIYRPEASLIASYPEAIIARYMNFTVLDNHPGVPVDRPIAQFPHESVASWSNARFEKARSAYFMAFEAFNNYIVTKGKENQREAIAMMETFALLAEPGLLPFYLELSPGFAQLFSKVKPELHEAAMNSLKEMSSLPSNPGHNRTISDNARDPLTDL